MYGAAWDGNISCDFYIKLNHSISGVYISKSSVYGSLLLQAREWNSSLAFHICYRTSTHLPLVQHICVSEIGHSSLVQLMACWLFGANMSWRTRVVVKQMQSNPSHYLNQLLSMVDWTPESQWNSELILIHLKNAFEIVVKMAAI